MRTYRNVKIENVRIQDGSFDVVTQKSGTYTFNIENQYRIDPNRLSDVMRCIDEWIATVYNTADRQGVEKPFNVDVDTDSATVEKVEVNISGSTRISQSLSEEVSNNFLRTDQVQKKR